MTARDSTQVSAIFGYEDTIVNPHLLDLTQATVTLDGDTYDVRADHGDDVLALALADLEVGHPIVSGAGKGFLKEVTAIERVTDYHYVLETADLELGAVLEQGTAYLNRQLTERDLLPAVDEGTGEEKPGFARFDGLPGIQLKKTGNANNTTFSLVIGDETETDKSPGQQKTEVSIKHEESLTVAEDPNGSGGKVEMKGSIEMKVSLDAGISMSGSTVQHFRIVPEITATSVTELVFTREMKIPERKKLLGRLPFKSIVFFAGPVPVVLTPVLELSIGAKGEVKGTLSTGVTVTQKASAGLYYNSVSGAELRKQAGPPAATAMPPTITGEFKATGFLEASLGIELWGLPGPSIPNRGNLELTAKASVTGLAACAADFEAKAEVFFNTSLKWELKSVAKLLPISSSTVLNLVIFESSKKKIWSDSLPATCGPFGKLNVAGSDFVEEEAPVEVAGVEENLSHFFGITNSSDKPLKWSSEFRDPAGALSMSPSSGTVPAGGSVTIEAVYDVGGSTGHYENEIIFKNDEVASEKASKKVEITVVQRLGAPNLTSVELQSGRNTVADAVWLADPDTRNLVQGYFVETTPDTDPLSAVWTEYKSISDPKATFMDVGGLNPLADGTETPPPRP